MHAAKRYSLNNDYYSIEVYYGITILYTINKLMLHIVQNITQLSSSCSIKRTTIIEECHELVRVHVLDNLKSIDTCL